MKNKTKMNAKDLINVGIYTAMYLVVFFVVGALNAIPVLYPISYFYLPIVTGIPFMLFITKITKFGMVTIMSCILGIFWFLMGYTWLAPLVYIVTGIIADLILKSGNYKNIKSIIFGYWMFSLGSIGCQMPMWILTDTYMADVRKQMGDTYTDKLIMYMPWWIGIVAIGVLFIGAVIGVLLGKKMLKKHFKKAGII